MGIVVSRKRQFDQHEGRLTPAAEVAGKIDGVVGRNQVVGRSQKLDTQNGRTVGASVSPRERHPLQPCLDDEGRSLPNSGNRRPKPAQREDGKQFGKPRSNRPLCGGHPVAGGRRRPPSAHAGQKDNALDSRTPVTSLPEVFRQ